MPCRRPRLNGRAPGRRSTSSQDSTPVGRAADAAARRSVQRSSGRVDADEHEVAEPLALEHLVQADERRRGPGATRAPATTRAAYRIPGSSATLATSRPPGASTRPTSANHSTVDSSGGTRPAAYASTTTTSALASPQPRHPGEPVDRPHPDAVPARERQLAAHRLGERGVRLQHHLRRPGPGVLHPAGQGEPGPADVGDPQRTVGREAVDAQGEVLHVLEVEPSGSSRSTADCGWPSSTTVTSDPSRSNSASPIPQATRRRGRDRPASPRSGAGRPRDAGLLVRDWRRGRPAPTMPVCRPVDAPTPMPGARP